MSGTLYGLGIGPGDPELITLKALRLLRAAPVIAYPAPEAGDSLARAIAAPHIPPDRTEIVMRTPMVAGGAGLVDPLYDRYADEIAGHLAAGRDVAALCEGDPLFYGSFMYLHNRLADRFPVVVVPGVSSLAAGAAAAGMPLVSYDEALSVLPATLAEETLERRLAEADAAVLMKVGRHLPKVRRVLARLDLLEGARYVERATMEGGRALPLMELPDDETAPYFSLVLVHRAGGAGR